VAIAALVVRVSADLGDFSKGLNKAVSAFDRAGAGFRRAGDKIAGIGSSLSVGITLPFVAASVAAVKFASDAEETASKMDTVFGSAADDMRRRLEDIAKVIPASRAELQGMASGMQDLLVPLGIAPGKAADMTEQIVRLAGDLASLNNIPVAEALEKIRSGLVGQNEPLLSFGVHLDAAKVKTEAFRLGLIESSKEFDSAARAQAALSLIFKGSTAALGNAADTAGSTANQFKFLKRDVANLAVTLGDTLIPLARSLTGILSGVVQRLSAVNPAIIQMGFAVVGVGAAMGPVLVVVGNLTKAFGFLAGVLKSQLALQLVAGGPILIGLAALAAIFIAVKSKTDDARIATERFGKALRDLDATEAAKEAARLRGEQDSLRESIASLERQLLSASRDRLPELAQRINDLRQASAELEPRIARAKLRVRELGETAGGAAARGVAALTEEERKAAEAADMLSAGVKASAAAFSALLGRPVDAYNVLIGRQRELQSELRKLNSELALTTKAEEAAKLVEQIDGVTAEIAKLAAGLRKIPDAIKDIAKLDNLKINVRVQVTVTGKSGTDVVGAPKQGGIGGGPLGPVAVFGRELADSIRKETAERIKAANQLSLFEQVTGRAKTVLAGAANGFLEAVKGLGGKLLDIINPLAIVGTVFDQAIRDATSALDGKFTESIGRIVKILVEALTPVLDALVPVFDAMVPIIRELAPILAAVGKIFAALFKAVAPILQAMVPLLRALFPVFKFVAIITTYLGQALSVLALIAFKVAEGVAKALGALIYGLGVVVKLIPGDRGLGEKIKGFGRFLINTGDAFGETSAAFGDAFDAFGVAREEIKGIELEDPVEEAAASVDLFDRQVVETTGSLLGLADAATVARDAVTGGPIVGATGATSAVRGGESFVIRNLTVPINSRPGESDTELFNRWLGEAKRRARTAGDTPRSAVDAFAVLEA
jgi:phage-related protein